MQNGVLKALSFLFEYIGEMGKDYIYAVSPLLEDALMDRDLVSPTAAALHMIAYACDSSNKGVDVSVLFVVCASVPATAVISMRVQRCAGEAVFSVAAATASGAPPGVQACSVSS